MVKSDFSTHLDIGRLAPPQYFCAKGAVGAHDMGFRVVMHARLEENIVGDGDLADIVHRTRVVNTVGKGTVQA
jgi:hypothetical protein